MPLTCYNCGAAGHRHRDCPLPCHRCGIPGHLFVHCTNNEERELVDFYHSLRSGGAVVTLEDVSRKLTEYRGLASSAERFFEVAAGGRQEITVEEFVRY